MDLLNKYYSIKSKVEETIKRKIAQIPKNLSEPEKKRLYDKFNINIVFEIKLDDKTKTRDFYIYNKSKVIMHIQLSNVYNVLDVLTEFKKKVDEVEMKIIILKNNILFDHTKLDNEKDNYEDLKKELEFYIVKINEIQTAILETNLPKFDKESFYNYIIEYKHTIKQGNYKLAVEYYIDTIIPFLKKQEYINNEIIKVDDFVYLNRNQFNYTVYNEQQIKKIIYDEEEIIKMFSLLGSQIIQKKENPEKQEKNKKNKRGYEVIDLSEQDTPDL
jgi:hypothetical protein